MTTQRIVRHFQDRQFILTVGGEPGRVILYSGWYSTELLRKFPHIIFVFGDNALRFGKGGQAIIRDEPNAFGVATKRKPAMSPGSFFMECEDDLDIVLHDIGQVWQLLAGGKTVVFPVREEDQAVSLGLERAELPQRAPTLYKAITMHVREMCDTYGFHRGFNETTFIGV